MRRTQLVVTFLAVVLAVVLAIGWAMVMGTDKSAQVGADEGEQLNMKEARKQAAQRKRRIIYNDDAGNARGDDTPERFLASRLQQVVDTQVDLVTYDPFYMDNVPSYPSRVVEPPTNPAAMVAAGHDPLALAVDFCHTHNMEFFASFRMNDNHESVPSLGGDMAIWKRQHPEYLMGVSADWETYPYSSPRAWWTTKNYEIPEVRDRQFLVIQEICENYDVDGIELDWWRDPIAFRPSLDLQPVEPRHIAMMNDFMRRVRKMTERVGQERGRPLLVAAHVSANVSRCLGIGLDVVTWLRDDLCDILVVGSGYAPRAMAPQVREMVEFAHPYNVPVYGCISNSGMSAKRGNASVEAWLGAAMNTWQAGGDGVCTFNLFPTEPDDRFSQMGSPETLGGLDKVYAVDYFDVENFWGNGKPGLVVPDRLPLTLRAGEAVTAKLQVGEDIVANAPEGKTTHARLRLRVSSLAQGDKVTVKLNGQALGTATPTEPLAAAPATAWVELDPDPNLVQAGENLVEVQLTTPRASEESIMLDRLDLVVRYQ